MGFRAEGFNLGGIKQFFLVSIGFCLVALVASSARAYLEVDETGALLTPGEYRVGVSPQYRLSNGSGGNVTARLDGYLNEDWSYRALLGGGETNFYGGASFKWIPIPDYDVQPALGVRFEGYLGHTDDDALSVFRITPLISKSFDHRYGKVAPYAALPLGLFVYKGTNDSISQFAVGAESKWMDLPNLAFGAELGFNLSRAFSYISFSATFEFTDDHPASAAATSQRKRD